MSENKVHVAETQDPLANAKNVWQKFQKQIVIGVAAVVIVVGGWYAYQSFIVQPKEAQASDAIFKAQQYFAQDSFKLALNGDGTSKGFISIINTYGGTKQANLAKYYAGICYLKTGDFNKSVESLNDFNAGDAKQIQMMAYGCLGDAYSELAKDDDAVTNYKKAAETFVSDEINTSEYLFRAALKLETMGKSSDALALYKQIKEKYPLTERGYQADKYIYRLSIEPNNLSAN